MVSLDRFETFRAVVDCGSLSAAADTLGQTRAVVSFNLKRLEAELGVSLLSRSTRRMALTDAGERFYQRCVKVLDEARLAIDDARAEHGELRGACASPPPRNTACANWCRPCRHSPGCTRRCRYNCRPHRCMPT